MTDIIGPFPVLAETGEREVARFNKLKIDIDTGPAVSKLDYLEKRLGGGLATGHPWALRRPQPRREHPHRPAAVSVRDPAPVTGPRSSVHPL